MALKEYIGYHGTCKGSQDDIKQHGFDMSQVATWDEKKETHRPWLAEGLYFFYDPHDNGEAKCYANDWATKKKRTTWQNCEKPFKLGVCSGKRPEGCGISFKVSIKVDEDYVFDMVDSFELRQMFSDSIYDFKDKFEDDAPSGKLVFRMMYKENKELFEQLKVFIAPTSYISLTPFKQDVIAGLQYQICVMEPDLITFLEEE